MLFDLLALRPHIQIPRKLNISIMIAVFKFSSFYQIKNERFKQYVRDIYN